MKFSLKMPDVAKRLEMDKADSRTLMIIVGLVVVGVFCLVSSKQLLGLATYQRKVISARNKALAQINKNQTAANDLIQNYQSFNSTNPNIIGGRNTADANAQPPDGDNARIILDALPSKYDFPALISSVYKLMANHGIASPSVAASDQSLTIVDKPLATPAVVTIPLSVTGTGDYNSIRAFIKDLERSIRPFDVTSLQLSGSNNTMTFTTNVNSYYQPAKVVDTSTKGIR